MFAVQAGLKGPPANLNTNGEQSTQKRERHLGDSIQVNSEVRILPLSVQEERQGWLIGSP
jgi:hypothetical protein